MKLRFLFCMAVFLTARAFGATIDFGVPSVSVIATFGGANLARARDLAPNDILGVFVEPPVSALAFRRVQALRPGPSPRRHCTGLGACGVGVSGTVSRRQVAEAGTVFDQSILNLDAEKETGPLFINYEIPNIEAAISAVPGVNEGPSAFAEAVLFVEVFDDTDTRVFSGVVFDYSLGINRTVGANVTFRSHNLLNEQGEGNEIDDGGAVGTRYDAFKGFRFLPSIPPAGRMDFNYMFNTRGETETPEVGYQAFVGDPFNISTGGGGFEISASDQSSPVPEPASILLLPGALAGILLVRRVRSRGSV